MIIKSFVADTVAGALKLVRSELGGDAVILKTKKLNPGQNSVVGGKVEVTACVDKSSCRAKSPQVDLQPDFRGSGIASTYSPNEIVRKLDFLIDIFQTSMRKSQFPGHIGQLFMSLLHADIPETMAYDLTRQLVERFTPEDNYELIAAAAAQLLHDQLPRQPELPDIKLGQKIALVGPAGGGKTSLMGRLAGYLVGNRKLAVCLTSLDTIKVAAPEELSTYADVLDIDHFDMPQQADDAWLNVKGRGKVTIIDTSALNTRDREEIRLYAEKLSLMKPHRIIGVFPATLRTSDLLDMIRAYKPLRLSELALTMTDQTSRLGGMIAVSAQTGLPVTILGTGRKGGCIDLKPDHRKIIGAILAAGEGIQNE